MDTNQFLTYLLQRLDKLSFYFVQTNKCPEDYDFKVYFPEIHNKYYSLLLYFKGNEVKIVDINGMQVQEIPIGIDELYKEEIEEVVNDIITTVKVFKLIGEAMALRK
ncbi:MAG: hypothetical protein ACOCRK_06155 [bacterium]